MCPSVCVFVFSFSCPPTQVKSLKLCRDTTINHLEVGKRAQWAYYLEFNGEEWGYCIQLNKEMGVITYRLTWRQAHYIQADKGQGHCIQIDKKAELLHTVRQWVGLLQTERQGNRVITYRQTRRQGYYTQTDRQGDRVITHRQTRRQGYYRQFELATEVRREVRQCRQSASISGWKEVGHKGGDMRWRGGGVRPRK